MTRLSTLFITILLSLSTLCRGQDFRELLPAELTDRPEIIIRHNGYTLSYNVNHGTANWSAWVLTKSHISGDIPRSETFYPDPSVPSRYRVTPSDYTNSGYDRGHLCPAADMAYSQASMHDCFYMSNMCPQVPALNRVSWKALETACRKWVMTEDTLYIVAGPVYLGDPKILPQPSSLNPHPIAVPNGFFKVILSLRKGHEKAIGFFYTNTALKQSLSSTAHTVDDIESLTGLDFFQQVDDALEELLESRCNPSDWNIGW